jgi:hypothetical protein
MRPWPLILIAVTLAACEQPVTVIPEPNLEGEKSWYGVVGPLVGTRCAICHRSDDIGPFPLENYEQVKAMAPAIKSAVSAKRMPPFPPDQTTETGCPRIDDVRRMTEAERKVLLDWIDAGLPEGTVRTLPPPPKNEPLGPPSETWPMAEEYTGTGTDDYRCFVVEPNVAAAMSVAAVSVKPGTRSVVHHASVYLVAPAQLSEAKQLDAAEPGPGYKCFGGVGISQAYPTGLWVPGNDAPLVPPNGGVGYYLLPGWAFVVQLHYNYSTGVKADRSSIVLWKANLIITEVPHALVAGAYTFAIPPNAMNHSAEGASDVLATGSIPSTTSAAEGRIYSVWAHQHQLGRSFSMDLVRADGTEQCLLRIPKWNFNWQSIYKLKDFVVAKAGDKVRVRCSWDNTTPRMITFGEGTADEMCLGSVAMLNP